MKLKRLYVMLLVGILCVPILSIHAEEGDEDDKNDMVSLPVQILDFKTDHLFFGYNMDSGLNFITNENYAPRLVEEKLVDGQLVYKKEEVERIAGLVKGALVSEYEKSDSQIYEKLREKLAEEIKGQIYINSFGKDGNDPFYNNGWYVVDKNENLVEVQGTDGQINIEKENVYFYQNRDGVVVGKSGVGKNMTRTIDLHEYAGQQIKCTCWLDYANSGFTIEVKNGTDSIVNQTPTESGWQDVCFTVPTEGAENMTLVLTGNSVGARIAALKILKTNNEECIKDLLGNNDNYFYDHGWEMVDSPENLHTSDGSMWDGDSGVVYKQDGDGIVHQYSQAYSIQKNYAVECNQTYQLKYWIDVGSDSLTGYKVTIKDANTKANIYDFDTDSNNGFIAGTYRYTFFVPDGVKEITMTLTPNGDNTRRITQMNLTPLGIVGNYEETVKRANQFHSLEELLNDDHLTCMDYTYFVLTHLFTETNGLNYDDNFYSYLVLNKKNGIYTFDSDDFVAYDRENKAIYNYASPKGEKLNGFFPLEKQDGFEPGFYEAVQTQYQTQNGNEEFYRNYHFTLKSGGTFFYHEDENQYFEFTGDDDVYLFINGKLAIDLGGAHQALTSKIELNDIADQYGLIDGEIYNFDFFYMERHVDVSNLKLNTNINVMKRIENPLQQKITFEFNGLEKENIPSTLYVQLYREVNGIKRNYDVPIKYTSGSDSEWDSSELTKLLQLEREGTYTIECISDLKKYKVKTVGEIVKSDDPEGMVKEYKFILFDPNKVDENGSITIILDQKSIEQGYKYKLYDLNDSVVGSGDVTKAGDTVTDLDIATYNLKVFDGEKDITKDVTISDNGIAELTTESLDKTLIVSYRDIASNDPNQPTDTIKDVDSKIPDKSEDKNTFIDVKTDDIQNVDEDINNGIQLVDTSDNNNVMLYLGLCVGVLFVLVGTIVLRKKEK